MEIFGSKKARRKFENAFKSDADWANVFLEDSRDLGTKDAATATADVLTQRAFTQYVKGLEEGFPKLPQKLQLMNAIVIFCQNLYCLNTGGLEEGKQELFSRMGDFWGHWTLGSCLIINQPSPDISSLLSSLHY